MLVVAVSAPHTGSEEDTWEVAVVMERNLQVWLQGELILQGTARVAYLWAVRKLLKGLDMRRGWRWPLSSGLQQENPEKHSGALWRCLILMFLLLTITRVLTVLLSSPIAEPLYQAVRGTPSQGSVMGSSWENWLSGIVRKTFAATWAALPLESSRYLPQQVWWRGSKMVGSRRGPTGVAGLVASPHPKIRGVFLLLQNCGSVLDLRLCVYVLFATRTLSGLWYK